MRLWYKLYGGGPTRRPNRTRGEKKWRSDSTRGHLQKIPKQWILHRFSYFLHWWKEDIQRYSAMQKVRATV